MRTKTEKQLQSAANLRYAMEKKSMDSLALGKALHPEDFKKARSETSRIRLYMSGRAPIPNETALLMAPILEFTAAFLLGEGGKKPVRQEQTTIDDPTDEEIRLERFKRLKRHMPQPRSMSRTQFVFGIHPNDEEARLRLYRHLDAVFTAGKNEKRKICLSVEHAKAIEGYLGLADGTIYWKLRKSELKKPQEAPQKAADTAPNTGQASKSMTVTVSIPELGIAQGQEVTLERTEQGIKMILRPIDVPPEQIINLFFLG